MKCRGGKRRRLFPFTAPNIVRTRKYGRGRRRHGSLDDPGEGGNLVLSYWIAYIADLELPTEQQ